MNIEALYNDYTKHLRNHITPSPYEKGPPLYKQNLEASFVEKIKLYDHTVLLLAYQ